jgi:GT2 family glycosyltransferase
VSAKAGRAPGVLVSAVVVNRSRVDLLRPCLASLRAALADVDGGTELAVVDNASSDGSRDLVRDEFPEAKLVALPANRGFAGGVAAGLSQTSGAWALLLNNDAVIEPEAIAELLAVGGAAPDIGSVACQMRFARRPPVINSAGIEVDRLGVAYDRLLGAPPSASEAEPVEVFGASAGAALYRRAMLDDVGGFDESFFLYLEDADLSWRARMRGWRAIYAPAALVHHHHSATSRHGSPLKHFHVGRNRVRLLAKNAETQHLRRAAAGMLLYDLAYVAFAAAGDGTLAPLRGRLRGLREWRAYRRAGAARRPVELAPARGPLAALRRRRTFSGAPGR